jgi:hypothetical protein
MGCEDAFSYEAQLYVHMRDVHKRNIPTVIPCEMCGRGFNNTDLLLEHILMDEHSCMSEHLTCACGVATLFQTEEHLEAHQRFCPHRPAAPVHVPAPVPPPERVRTVAPPLPPPSTVDGPKSHKHISIELAPEPRSVNEQSVLHMLPDRKLFSKSSLQIIDTTREVTPANRQAYVQAGYMHCAKCVLVYNPQLVMCRVCGNLHYNQSALIHHELSEHDEPEPIGMSSLPTSCLIVPCSCNACNRINGLH